MRDRVTDRWMAASRLRYDRGDAWLALIIFSATVLYISWLPRNLSPADESVYLYEAKRILEGQVLYRDIFEIITPGWMYLMALLFRIFGTDLATARIAMAVMHGVGGVVIYLTCRRLGIRRGWCWPAALAYLVISQPAWPIASQHWLTTLICVVLLLVCAGRQPARAAWPLLPGLVIGVLIGVQQQRGSIMAVGTFTWLVVDHALQRRYRPSPPAAPLVTQLSLLVAGALIVVLPLCAGMIASAGFQNVWRALVIHPIFNYGGTTHCEWGHINVMTAPQGSYTFPRLLKYLPLVLIVSLLRLVVQWVRRQGQQEVRTLTLLILYCLFSMLSIAYFPDFIHIAFIAPAFFVAIAENLEWTLRLIPAPPKLLRAGGWLLAAGLLAASGLRLHRNMTRAYATYRFTLQTAFGRVDVADARETQLYEKIAELMETVPSRELFCYPIVSHLYLMADADNPTRYQFFWPGYNSPDQVQEVLDTLKAKNLPYILALPAFLSRSDPIMDYIRSNYEPLTDAGEIGKGIFRRKDLGVPPPLGKAD